MKFFNFSSSKFFCPFCFQISSIEEIYFQCINNNCQKDEILEYNEFWGKNKNFKINHVFKPKSYKDGNPVCDECSTTTTRAVCPRCFNIVITNDDKPISLIGATSFGKSVYLTVIFHLILKKKLFSDLQVFPVDSEIFNIYSSYEEELFKKKKLLPGTNPIEFNKNLRIPLIKELKLRERKYKNYLIIFDVSGEDVEKDINKIYYLDYSGGYILFLDVSNSDALDKSLELLDTLWKKEKNNNKLVIRKPTAVVIPKFDIFTENIKSFPFKNIIDKKVVMDNGLSINRNALVDKDIKIREFLLSEDLANFISNGKDINTTKEKLKNLVDKVDKLFNNYKFFAVSSLGFNPKNPPYLEKEITPILVEEPLIYLMNKLGIL